jgi:type IV secretory pathway ATPase VirB11/archaellum biosynthesis ATPase
MFDEEKDILTIECEGCAKIGSAAMSSECNECIGKRKFDILRLKTDLFTKEYDKKRRLLNILPFFMDIRIESAPRGIEPLEEYLLPTGAKVEIFKDSQGVNTVYNIKIPETNITFSEIMEIGEEFEEFQETNETNNDLIHKWFLGFGILEHLLRDKKILEININPPGPKTAMRIVHADYDEMVSNIYPSEDFLNHLATRLKISTGRPLNKAQPQLDGEIKVGKTKARVAAIIEPFSIMGTGYSIRVHRESPWTLPLLNKYKSINPMFSGLMSFIITHGRSFLSAGPRGSGKTSLLGALMLEILPKYRIITIEDTQELPINSYKKLGYDLLPMKVRSALLDEGMEMPFDTGLRTCLRLGDSCLIVGEIRSKEGKVLYEAMRVGAMSNVVAGTIHSDSPYGVYDRVVHDLGVEKGSFKVTDIIIIVNQIKDPTGLSRSRRVLQVTEVLKDWTDEPEFQDLMVYDPKKDELIPTDILLKGKSIVLKEILKRTKGYNNYNDLLKDIKLRAWSKELFVKIAELEELEAPYIAYGNVLFAKLFNEILPLKNPRNEAEFKKRFEEDMMKYLEDKRKDRPIPEEEEQTEEEKEEIISEPKKVNDKKKGLLTKLFLGDEKHKKRKKSPKKKSG